ncbi:MAG: UDP-N-acetylmuramoyl-tripeptide--D-alanyl-D-alanine ligase [Bacteroidetes bacterium]|nr:UDP-N-acetylmuramoyl-tripeptide--D-alanyl-D-alanine ligase [Bacteroidota bacterium]
MKIYKRDILSLEHCEHSGFEHLRGVVATGVSIDSRTISKGDIFIALRGERYDGHDFLSIALNGGAAAVVLEKQWVDANRSMFVSIDAPKIVVPNTTRALGELARNHRRKFSIPLLVVAGSNGKTTTKELIAAVLKERYRVLYTEKNYNNHIGVPLTLFKLEQSHDIGVLEAGTNHNGELMYLCTIAEPTHGLITNIGREHLEFFGSLEGVARAEGELFEYLREHNGTLIINADDSWIEKLAQGYTRVVRYGFQKRSVFVRGKRLRIQDNGCATFTVKTRCGKEFSVVIPIPGVHNAMNALAAVTIGLLFHVPKKKIQKALEAAPTPSKRMEVFKLNGILILDDSYNANPDSVHAALRSLAQIRCSGKRVAVLGDMLELGEHAPQYHREIGEALATYSIDLLITYGPLAHEYYIASTIAEKYHCEKKEYVYNILDALLKPGDCVLIKGSRGMKMEDIVHHLRKQYSQSREG